MGKSEAGGNGDQKMNRNAKETEEGENWSVSTVQYTPHEK